MDQRLRGYYERELRHIRETAAEFAREYPKIAGRLALDEFECADPYVERLLEGFAFLTARVQLKLDAEFPRFTQHMLEAVYPQYLSPMPSMCIVQIRPDLEDSGLASGFTVPRGTALRSTISRHDQTACEYRTAHEVTLAPLELVDAQYHDRDLLSLELPRDIKPAAVIRLRLRATAGLMLNEIETDRLALHFRGSEGLPFKIYERLVAHTGAILARPTTRPAPWTERLDPKTSLRQMGFGNDEALLPVGPRSFQGYRHLQEYFTFPERFLFVEVSGLRAVFERLKTPTIELLFALDEGDPELEQALDAKSFALHCTPAINLFPKRCDRIHVSDRFSEFHLVPDRTRPLDYEVYDIVDVTGIGGHVDDERVFRPFYKASDLDEETGDGGAFVDTSRVPRTLTDRERRSGRRSSYPGSEVYLRLVDASAAPYRSDLRQLAVTTRCTNRDLPLRMPVGEGRTDFSMDIGGAVEAIRCLGKPTPPRPSFIEGEVLWRLISHLSLNYLSLADAERSFGSDFTDPSLSGAAAMRDLLKIYGNLAEAHTRKQIEGLRGITSRPVTRRAPTKGPITFARGLQVTLRFEEHDFEGASCFLLGAVLERFFAKYVSINSFTETIVETRERGEIMRWPTRIGTRHTL